MTCTRPARRGVEAFAGEAEVASERDFEVERQRQIAHAAVGATLRGWPTITTSSESVPTLRRLVVDAAFVDVDAARERELSSFERERALAVGDETQVGPVDDGEVFRLPLDARRAEGDRSLVGGPRERALSR